MPAIIFLRERSPASSTRKNLRTTPTIDVTSIYDAGNGFLWIATRVHGVYLFNKRSHQLSRLPEIPGQKEWKAAEPISITSDRNGRIWIACFYDGLHVYDRSGKHLHSFSRATGSLISGKLTFLLSEPEHDAMWLSTRDAGLLLLKLQDDSLKISKRFSFHPQGLKTDYMWPLTKSRSGDLWVGTIGGGLHRIDSENDRVERYDQWLPETDVESILEDESGMLWIGGNGLYRLDPESKSYLHFDVADGLQSNSFKVASAAQGADGILYFGGIGGVTYFNPKNVSTNPHPPKMQITQLRILNYAYSPENKSDPRALISGPFSPDHEITIRAFENDFSIEFVGLNYINPGKQHYEYKLEGYHKNWISLPQGQRVMGFSNLPAGNYTFLVKADNGDGVWTDEPARLRLRILPPWYRTWWAYLFYAVLVTSAVVWYKQVTGKQRELKNKIAIEQVAKEKEKELADLKLNFFTNVSHELRTPLTLIMSPSEYLIQSSEAGSEARQKAELVHKQAHKLLDLVNQLMNFRKVETGNVALQLQTLDIVPFITEIFLIFKLKADEQETRYTPTVPDRPVWVSFDPEKLEIVLTNLLSNAFKYTPENGSIEVHAEYREDNGHIAISVKDSGTGIHEDELSYIFEPFYQAYKIRDAKTTGTGIGLSLVHELVKKHHGKIAVTSTPGKGSVFTIKLPLGENRNVSPESPAVPAPAPRTEPLLPDHTLEYRLLIVEDNDDLRAYLVSLFHTHFETHSAANGREGLEKVALLLPTSSSAM
ncbi:MAG: ATP-binding protein [Leadbetterella sp.]|nr:ATP-binding protein [Leadbetterella sp.]